MTRASTPDSVSFRRFLPFSPWRAPASLQRNVARQHRREYADSARLRLKNQKSLENPSLAGAYSFAGAEICPDKERPAENTCRIVKGLDAVWAHFCPSKPCLPLSIDGNILYECVNEIGRRGCGSTTPQPPAHSSESRGGTEIDYSAFSATAASFFLARAFSSQSLPSAKRETM